MWILLPGGGGGCSEYECNNGQCIDNDEVCDGREDCNDGEDERDCK